MDIYIVTCVCVRVRACVRACVRVCVCALVHFFFAIQSDHEHLLCVSFVCVNICLQNRIS